MPSPTPPPSFALFDRATVPAPLEMDTTIGMEQFQSAEEQQARSYAETVRLGDDAPAGTPSSDAGGELLPGLVMPGAASGGTEPTPPLSHAKSADLGVAEAMVMCRRRNRVAPVPPAWDLLLAQLQTIAGTAPSLPDGDSLATRSMLTQRMVMRDLLVWAAARRLLPEAMAFLERLPETAWSHMES